MATSITPTIDASGMLLPDYPTILDYLKARYREIYGDDVYLEPDAQDCQFLAIFAAALVDTSFTLAQVYNAFSPATAQGEGLSRVVKINGLARAVPTNSTVDIEIGGQVGTTILNGVVRDVNNINWLLPTSVVIPPAGVVTVTATAATLGAVEALPGTVELIATPTLGWQTATNAAAASAGDPVESDAALRRRQSFSTALPSRTILDGLFGALLELDGVGRLQIYENATAVTDGDGVPAHSIAVVIEGGAASDIAENILLRKTLGTGTYGTTPQVVTDAAGIPRTIYFSRPTTTPIQIRLTIASRSGYTSLVGDAIKQALSDHVAALPIGEAVSWSALFAPARTPEPVTFDITSLEVRLGPSGSWGVVPIDVDWDALPSCPVGSVTLTVT